MTIQVLLFAAARDRAGTDLAELPLAGPVRISRIQSELVRQYPQLTSLAGSLLWAVNNRYAAEDQEILETDAVACFPPVSGG